MRIGLLLMALGALPGCYTHRHFVVPPTEEAHWCGNHCTAERVRCMGGRLGVGMCERYQDTCLAGCPGAHEVDGDAESEAGQDFQRSRYTGLKEVVTDEDKLRQLAGQELACDAGKLEVFAVEGVEIPGWTASVAGCGKTAIYKVNGRAGWAKQ